MQSETQIICTIGPASSDEKILLKMAKAGMNVVRLNMSHGNHQTQENVINTVRKINTEKKLNIKILMDLEGYRIRIGKLAEPVEIRDKELILLSADKCQTDKKCLAFDYTGDLKMIPTNTDLFIDDGHLRLKILEAVDNSLLLKVIQGGVIKSRKGINIPEMKMPTAFLSKQDRKDIQFGLKNQVDFIAQSFVNSAASISLVVDEIKRKKGNCLVFAKIENAEGVKNINSILKACDGIMVARGDLGISLPVYKVPIIQKYIINRCNRLKKQVIPNRCQSY
ncbi:MAG: pyruvate kinase [Candidatus Cloacimonadales bacterium]|nr:pyruvate kinase [Candidatus Cloacimonadales bacterium]